MNAVLAINEIGERAAKFAVFWSKPVSYMLIEVILLSYRKRNKFMIIKINAREGRYKPYF